jgi:beta-aspartyl-peptidase (threonine type)
MPVQPIQPVIAVHGGAGTVPRSGDARARAPYLAGLNAALQAGAAVLAGGGAALDAVTAAVASLEDCPLFNAGHGAVLTEAGTVELDACVMDGASQRAGAVAGVTRLRNPVRAARLVMERSGCVLMAGEGAERFAAAQGAILVDPAYFVTPERRAQWQAVCASDASLLDLDVPLAPGAVAGGGPHRFGTVGAVALDAQGHLAAATSTGGMLNKRLGRIGDSPVVGAGCYANDGTCAVSCTGTGERFIEAVAAYDVSALMQYAGLSAAAAATKVIGEKLPAIGGAGGMIVLDPRGAACMPFNTEGMYRGWLRPGGVPMLGIHEEMLAWQDQTNA